MLKVWGACDENKESKDNNPWCEFLSLIAHEMITKLRRKMSINFLWVEKNLIFIVKKVLY